CVGSQLAFLWYLKSIGKKAECFCFDPLPQKFAFLENSGLIRTELPKEKFDVLMILDCSSVSRLGWDVENSGIGTIINIDHHRDNTNFGSGELNFVDPAAAAAGEIIFSFFNECNINFPPAVAEALYTAILTDTGGFRFSNTNSNVLNVCAQLAGKGADCAGIYDKVYSSHTPQALVLQSRIWSSLTFYFDGKICCMDMPMSILKEIGAQYSDSEGMADNTITAIGAEVGIMTKHTNEETHFSLRSRGKVDVGRVAQKIPGGGGHCCAAGCTIKLPYKEAMELMLAILAKELE
ncbi:MAG: DHH family phosphoesterase, partial [Chitinispirillales bacterium]|nr:DHH family phosphoesterase [Chitinispirillales bacterium]